MHNSIIIRYGEIVLKGKNRKYFELKLVKNIKACFKKNNIEYKKIERKLNRIIIETDNDCKELINVFGIISYSPSIKIDFDFEKIKEVSLFFIKDWKKGTFRISAKKIDNSVDISSRRMNEVIGEFILTNKKLKVKLTNFEHELGIEIIQKQAYIFDKKIACFGGLPLGIEGKAISLIEDKNSLLASLLVMKRGCFVIPISFKKVDIILLKKFSYGYNIELQIIKSLKEIEKIAEKENAKALIVNHTLDNFKEINTNLPVLRPLIGMDEKEAKKRLRCFIQSNLKGFLSSEPPALIERIGVLC